MRRQALLQHLGEEIRANQRATDEVDDLIARLLGISRTDSRCLDILEQYGRVSAGQLAALSRLTTGAVTAVLDHLERAGFAQRVPDPSDRRRVLVELTGRGRELIWELMGRPLREASQPLIDRYSERELEMLIDFQRQGRELQQRHAEWLRKKLPSSPLTPKA